MATSTSQQINEDIILHTIREEDPWSIIYELEVNAFKCVTYKVDFSGSQNLMFENESGTHELIIVKEIQPFNRERICKLVARDPDEDLSIKSKRLTTIRDPPDDIFAEYVRKYDHDISSTLDKMFLCRIDDDSLSLSELSKRCTENQLLFVDPEFPPQAISLLKTSSGEVEEDKDLRIHWRRPREYLVGDYFVFDGLIEAADIKQGALGDCWFLCALAALAEYPALVKRLFVEGSDQVNEAGAYKLRFCKNGEWQNVLVDDMFPCRLNGPPQYARCHGNEIWVQLVEKAYAKLHGSYNLTRAGMSFEAMLDLTGDPFENFVFSEDDVKESIRDGSLFQRLKEFDAQGDIMTLSTPGNDTFTETGRALDQKLRGLVPGHAYTLIAVSEPKAGPEGLQLVQIRNPWGHGEWTGDWSDESPLWTQYPLLKQEVGAKDEDDGSFWMSFGDMVTNFDEVNVCISRMCTGASPWVEKRKKAIFAFKPDGGISTSMYDLTVYSESTYYISAHQQDRRVAQAQQYIDVGVSVFRLSSPGDLTGATLVDAAAPVLDRQMQLKVKLSPGSYVVVPTCTGCPFQQILDEEQTKDHGVAPPVILFSDPEKRSHSTLSGPAVLALQEVFNRFNFDMDGLLGKRELDFMHEQIKAPRTTDEQWLDLMKSCDSKDNSLTINGFKDAVIRLHVEGNNGGEEELWAVLEALGYSRRLNLLYARSFVLAVHSDCPFELHSRHFDPVLYESAMDLPIVTKGVKRDMGGGKACIFTRKGGNNVSIAVQNLSDVPLTVELDCGNSKNVVSNRGSLKASEVILPGKTAVMHHLMPRDKSTGWAWSYSVTTRA